MLILMSGWNGVLLSEQAYLSHHSLDALVKLGVSLLHIRPFCSISGLVLATGK